MKLIKLTTSYIECAIASNLWKSDLDRQTIILFFIPRELNTLQLNYFHRGNVG